MQALSARLDRFVVSWLGLGINDNQVDFDAVERLDADKRAELVRLTPPNWVGLVSNVGERLVVVAVVEREGDVDQPVISVEAKPSRRGFCLMETHDQYPTVNGARSIRDVETFVCPDAAFFWRTVTGAEAKIARFPTEVRDGMRGYVGYGDQAVQFVPRGSETVQFDLPYRRFFARVSVFSGGNGNVELLPSLDPRNVCCMFFGIFDFVGFPSWSAVKRHLGLLTMNLDTACKAERLQADCVTKGWTCVVGAQHRDCTITCGDESVTVVLYDDEWLMHKYALVNQAGFHGQYISLHRNSRAELTNLLDGLLSVPPPLEDAPD